MNVLQRDTHNIERCVLASVLNFENTLSDIALDKNFFTDAFHIKLVVGINRLKEIDAPIDFEVLRKHYIKAKKWSYQEDAMLIDMVSNTTPFGTKHMFSQYLNILRVAYIDRLSLRIAS